MHCIVLRCIPLNMHCTIATQYSTFSLKQIRCATPLELACILLVPNSPLKADFLLPLIVQYSLANTFGTV